MSESTGGFISHARRLRGVRVSLPAYLADRICFFEGRPQLYGTHSDWNDEGLMAIYMLDAPERVNELRAGVGLPPLDLSKTISDQRIPPEKLAHHREQMNAWAKSVGWRK